MKFHNSVPKTLPKTTKLLLLDSLLQEKQFRAMSWSSGLPTSNLKTLPNSDFPRSFSSFMLIYLTSPWQMGECGMTWPCANHPSGQCLPYLGFVFVGSVVWLGHVPRICICICRCGMIWPAPPVLFGICICAPPALFGIFWHQLKNLTPTLPLHFQTDLYQ